MSIFNFIRSPRSSNSRHNSEGAEVLDSTPMALPVGFTRPPTLQEQVARLVRSEAFRIAAEKNGIETFEEADDFDDPDDDPTSPYEEHFDLATVASTNQGLTSPPKPLSPDRLEQLKSLYMSRKKAKAPSGSSDSKEGASPSPAPVSE